MFCQAHVCVMVKPTNIVLDRQKFKCSPNNACSFGRGLRQIFLAVRAEMTKRSTVIFVCMKNEAVWLLVDTEVNTTSNI